MKREDWQKVYTPAGDGLDIRVRNTLSSLEDAPKRRVGMRGFAALTASLMLMVAAVAAVATGMLFSDDYDAVRLANRALVETYGITDEMQTYFTQQITEENGVTTVSYISLEGMRHVLGVYTVVIEGGNVTAAWSGDGISTEGGLDAYAWGAEQIEMLLEIAKEDSGYARGYKKAQEIRAEMEKNGIAISVTNADDTTVIKKSPGWIDEENMTFDISEEQAVEIAKQAFAEEYNLTDAQIDMMEYQPRYAGYTYALKDGKVICEVWFWLHQVDGVYHTDGDGLYMAEINAQIGVVENMRYNSALAGNG